MQIDNRIFRFENFAWLYFQFFKRLIIHQILYNWESRKIYIYIVFFTDHNTPSYEIISFNNLLRPKLGQKIVFYAWLAGISLAEL